MKTISESAIERRVVDLCRTLGLLTYKFSSPAHRGVPDRIIIGSGRIMFLELKRRGERPTRLQLRELTLLLSEGMTALWTDDYEDARRSIVAHFC